jgi:hypothetical protein
VPGVSVTAVPASNASVQSPPQEMPAGELVTSVELEPVPPLPIVSSGIAPIWPRISPPEWFTLWTLK